jgi:hypothetical protein
MGLLYQSERADFQSAMAVRYAFVSRVSLVTEHQTREWLLVTDSLKEYWPQGSYSWYAGI